MKGTIREKLALPENVQKYLIGTLYDISVDDSNNKDNGKVKDDNEISNKWVEERLAEAGFIEKTTETNYPKKVHEHVVLSKTEAINLDNIAASYAATLRREDPMRANVTLSTVDAFYTNEKGTSYFIEFKNGKWEKGDIKGKVFESRALLDDIKVLDKYAIVTSNREKDSEEVENLNLSEKFKAYCGLDGSADFYKKHVQLLVVYSGKEHAIKSYIALCEKRDNYEQIERRLQKADFPFLRKILIKSPKVDFGYETINCLAKLLITTDSKEDNFMRFSETMTMLERMNGIEENDKKIKKACEQLDRHPELMKLIYDKMYKGDKKAERFLKQCGKKETLNPQIFLQIAAKMSVREGRSLEFGKKDDFNIIIEIVEHSETVKEKKFCEIIEGLYKEIEGVLPELEIQKESICDANFTNLKTLAEQGDYEEFIKRTCFIYRMIYDNSVKETEEKYKIELLKNICGIEEDFANRLAKASEGKEKVFTHMVLLWNYLYKDSSIRDDVEKDIYVHMVRQIEYLYALNNGHRDKQKYGPFAKRINNKTKHLKGEDKQKKIIEEAKKIESEIMKGKGIHEIMPLQGIIKLTISGEERKIRELRAILKGTVLLDVRGCKAVDFSEAQLQ